MKYPLRFVVSYVQPVTCYTAFRIKNCSNGTSAILAYQKKEMVPQPSYINYCLKSEVSITLRCQLCSTITNQELFENHLCYQNSHYDKYVGSEAIMCYHQIGTFRCQQR